LGLDCITDATASFSSDRANRRLLLPRLFVSHSSKDNIQALAFQHWLMEGGWSEEDVFIDLHGIGAGERWRERLRKANASCEAVLLLASPDALDSPEVQRELNLAEDLGKEIIVAILRDLTKGDPRLARWADRQFVDLSSEPTERMAPFEHEGRVHRVEFNPAALASIKARLAHLGIAPDSFAWTPHGKEAGPYPGLAAFDEADAGIFFGRDADIMAGLTDLRLMRRRHSPRLLVIVAASGAGKSSYLRAGLWPRLKRDPDYAPLAMLRPAQGILTGPDGLGRQLARWFGRHGRVKLPGDIHTAMARSDEEAAAALGQLLAEAAALATTARRAGAQEARPPAPLLAIDQSEELFTAENASESERFLRLLATVLRDPPDDVDPYMLVTIRADSVEALLRRWPALGLATPQSRYLAPLSPAAYREVILRPAEVYSQRVRALAIEPALVDALVRDAEGADALPLLAFTLERLFGEFGTDGKLTLSRYEAMGGIGGSIDRALAEAQYKAGAAGARDALRRLIIPHLATWDPTANAAKRLVAPQPELIGGDRAELAPLADRLVEARLLTRGRGTIEVAHEALLRRAPISLWLEAQKEALKLRDDVRREAREWDEGGRKAKDLVRRGERLAMARDLLGEPDFAGALAPAKDYLDACRKQEKAGRRLARLAVGAIMTLMAGVIVLLLARIYEPELRAQWAWASKFWRHAMTAAEFRKLNPSDPFAECANVLSHDLTTHQIHRYCPDMVVLPAGKFMMGEKGKQHEVTIAGPFAVSKFALTFDQWDACVAGGGCDGYAPIDAGWGRGIRPVIYVSWIDATHYVEWLNRMTGTKSYRLLSEAEFEYAARAGTTTDYPWGDEIGKGNANCAECGSQWDGKQTAPVGSFPSNKFSLYDMQGNVWQWVEDAFSDNSDDLLPDGSALKGDSSSSRVLRGGSWVYDAYYLRSAFRIHDRPGYRDYIVGFRVARTLLPPTP
jgi:formylglycine-generating enzyme required for sulfatase activity